MNTTASSLNKHFTTRVGNKSNDNEVRSGLYHRIAQRAKIIAEYKATAPLAKTHTEA